MQVSPGWRVDDGGYARAGRRWPSVVAGRLVRRMAWKAVMTAGISTGNRTRTSIPAMDKYVIMICSLFFLREAERWDKLWHSVIRASVSNSNQLAC
jgi:hypothetical protein